MGFTYEKEEEEEYLNLRTTNLNAKYFKRISRPVERNSLNNWKREANWNENNPEGPRIQEESEEETGKFING